MNERNRRIITILSIFTIIFTVMGGSLAYWNWSSTTRTGVAFTIDKDFSCSADGGGNIAPTNISLEPSSCTNPNTTIKRKIVVTPDIKKSGLEISLDMWLNINSIGTPLSNSANLKYVLTTSGSSCEEGTIISKGNFSSKTTGDRVMLLEKNYTADASETYYLYIWLDKEETSMDTMNQSFNFSLGGNCSNYVGEPEAPVLDPSMIPVTIANDGTVTTVSKDDPEWYDYSNKEWANVVLVNEEATEGVTGSHPRSYYKSNVGTEVTQEDIVAYYVWIPRYKYRIPTNTTCGEIENVNPTDYPGCYRNAYIVLDESKTKSVITSWMENNGNVWPCSCSYDLTEEGSPYGVNCSSAATRVLEDFLDDGKAYIDCDGMTSIDAILTSGVHYQKEYVLIPNKYFVGNPTSIDIIFESKDENMILGNTTTQYRSHPAFWNNEDNDNIVDNGEMLSGFWMAKFEPSVNTVNDCIYYEDFDGDGVATDCVAEGNVHFLLFLPMKNSGSASIWYEFEPESKSFDFDLNTTTTKTHQMDNNEWGAVAYLSHSNYGINKEVRINNTSITGCGALSDNATSVNNCDNGIKYGSGVSSYPQSTTGNISGIFDMSGGKKEPVISDADYLYHNTLDGSFFAVDDIMCNKTICFGSAITEVSGWYNDFSTLGSDFSLNWNDPNDFDFLEFYRGGDATNGELAGLFTYELFENGSNMGGTTLDISRETIIVK